jgi:phosphopantetheinyl transferase (holo-ACP synthase)
MKEAGNMAENIARDDGVFVYLADISPLFEQSVYKRCYDASSQMRRDKADDLATPKDKARCIGAGLLLTCACRDFLSGIKSKLQEKDVVGDARVTLVTELLNTAEDQMHSREGKMQDAVREGISEWQIAEEKGKKPYFCREDGSRDTAMPYFNISHSGKYVGCALSWSEVGFDIQQQRKPQQAVLNRVFSEEERNSIMAGENPALTFAGLWAEKEAAVKLDGRGIAALLTRRDAGLIHREDSSDVEKVHILSGFIDGEYAWSAAYKKQQ